MVPGSRARISEEENFRMGMEHPDSWMRPAEKAKARGWGLSRELDPQTTDLLGRGLLLALGWTRQLALTLGQPYRNTRPITASIYIKSTVLSAAYRIAQELIRSRCSGAY
ncbi:hypothetical protein DPX16_16524 [Anabarilius grahami]|uniref:Uncharacterized protein n=1 Tax=Anabarilius grahami TaxID=495550 RepID=A0A3N0XUY7_ANAGA|nr:hypothetical protein DPX16_16524 [Anabarilius grahami]